MSDSTEVCKESGDIPEVEDARRVLKAILLGWWQDRARKILAHVLAAAADFRASGQQPTILAARTILLRAVIEVGIPPSVPGSLLEDAVLELLMQGSAAAGAPLAGTPAASGREPLGVGLEALVVAGVLDAYAHLDWRLRHPQGSSATSALILGAIRQGGASDGSEVALQRRLTSQEAFDSASDIWAYRWFAIGGVAGTSVREDARTLIYFNNPPAGPDGRTTPFCRWVHGRTAPAEDRQSQAAAYVVRILSGKDGFLRAPLVGNDETSSREFARHLSDSIGLPPFHHRCRTVVRRA